MRNGRSTPVTAAGSDPVRRSAAAASRRVELGEFGLDVDGDDAEVVDVLGVGRGDVSEDLIGHIASLAAPLPHGQLAVLGRSGDDRAGQHGQVPGLSGLAGQVRLADGAVPA